MRALLAFLPVLAAFSIFSCSRSAQEKKESPFDVLQETYTGPVPGSHEPNNTFSRRARSSGNTSSREHKDDKPVEEIAQKSLASETQAMDSLYHILDKKPQLFTISATQESDITCAEGTLIRIPAFSFTDQYRRPVYGTVVLEVKEYYKLEDMLFANLNSQSEGNMLESSGMVCIKAHQEAMELKIAKGKHIRIKMPASYTAKGMQLFYGTINDRKQTWHKAKNKLIPPGKIKTYQYTIDQTISYTKTNHDKIRLGPHTLSEPDPDDKLEVQDTILLSFAMDSKGTITNHRIILNREKIHAENYTVEYEKEQPKHSLHREEGNKLRLNREYRIHYTLKHQNNVHGLPLSNYMVDLSSATIRELRKAFKRGDSSITITISEVYIHTNDRLREQTRQERIRPVENREHLPQSYYSYQIDHLGQLSNNRFYTIEKKEQANYQVQNVTGSDDVKIVFTGMKSILQGLPTGSRVEFSNIPVNTSIIVIGVRYNRARSCYEFATTKTTTSDPNTQLQYVSVASIEELKKKITDAVN